MSSKSCNSSSPSTTASSSKLPKFLQSNQYRDRSQSMIVPTGNNNHTASSSSLSETLIIVEPLSPQVKMHPECPLSSVSDNHLSYYQSSHSATRLYDTPIRLSGWFQHTFNSSATDLSLPQLINSANLPAPSNSPRPSPHYWPPPRTARANSTKTMRYLSDSGLHPTNALSRFGFLASNIQAMIHRPTAPSLSRRGSVDSRRAPFFHNSTSSTVSSPGGKNTHSPSSSKNHAVHWSPEVFC